MKHLFSILLLLAGYAAAAQHNWLQGAGSNANDEALDIAHDVYGNVYSAGYFSQSARFDHTIIPSAGLSDVFIAKQDSAGTFLWIAKAGGTLDDKAFAVAVAPSGDIYVAGVYKGTATFGAYTFTSSGGSQDVFVAKLNSSGNFIWAKSFGGSDVDIATDIAVDPHNNVIVSGQFKGVAQFGSFADAKGRLGCGGLSLALKRTGRVRQHPEADSSEGPASLTVSQGRARRVLAGNWGCAC